MSDAIKVSPAQLEILLAACIPAHEPVLITGAPGIGKTDIIHASTAAVVYEGDNLPYDLMVSHPVVSDPTDFKGLPFANAQSLEATFLPFGDLARAINCKRPTVWFFDDIGQAPQSVQAALMQLFLARHINGKKISDHITFVGATNRRADRAGVTGILEPVKSRFSTIVELEPSLDSWCTWAIAKGIPITLIAFLRYKPDLLSLFIPTADMSNSPMPRTWSNLARLEALHLPDAVEFAAFAGAVGEGAAGEYKAFRSMYQSLISVDAILADPSGCTLPTRPNELYAIATAIASKATVENLSRIVTIANRLHDAARGEFAALLLRDSMRRNPQIQHTDTFVRMACSPVGRLLDGQAS